MLLLLSAGVAAQDSLSYWQDRTWFFSEPLQPDSLTFYYNRIASHQRNTDDLEGFLYTYWDWQAAHFDEPEIALALLDTAVQQIWRKPKIPTEMEALLWVEVNRGFHRFQLGRVTGAVRAYERALGLYEAHRFEGFEALDYLYLPLGAHYTRLGDNEKARTLYEEAIAAFSNEADAGTLAGLYNNIGLTYWNAGLQGGAIAAYEKGLALEGLPPEQAGLLYLSAGRSYRALEQQEQAMVFAEKALSMLEPLQQSGHPPEGLQDYLSGAYLLKGQLMSTSEAGLTALPILEKARSYALEARSTRYHRTIAKVEVAIGEAWLRAQQPGQALEAYHAALCSLFPNLPEADAFALPDTAQLYGENTIYEALAGKANAWWRQYRKSRDLNLLEAALQSHQLASRAEWQLRQWLQYESSKITLLSQSRSRVGRAIEVARELYERTGDEQYLHTAWAFSGQVKAAVLLDAVRRNHRTSPSGQALRQQLAYFERQLLLHPQHDNHLAWLKERDDLQEKLQAAFAESGQNGSWARTLAYRSGAVEAAAKHSAVVVEYFVGDRTVEIFAQMPGQEAVWVQLPDASHLQNKVVAFQQLVQSRQALENSGAYPELAFALYESLLGTILEKVPGRLLIVPDAWLSALPFEALYTQPGDSRWSTAPFLVQQTDLHYAFSLRVLEQQQQLHVRAPEGLLHFSPRFAAGERGLPPLLSSGTEIPASWKKTTYTGPNADWAQLQQYAGQYRILHLSTHGTAADSLPRIECYDRAAYLPDIYALPLNAELVVLSACETGLGTFEEGEGVMSLSRAFTYAGSRGLVASLWAINESATGHLLSQMYGYLEEGRNKGLALAQAKRAYLADGQVPAFRKSPYYWAGMVYVGEAGALQYPPEKRLAYRYGVWGGLGLLTLLFLIFWLKQKPSSTHR
ncbi:MAG: CHAT domain-containing tetratricopeptide repeat protein [Phaeodactylibacter sp.]|uniref:CHAT domain-containing protein n=1 Tax=Phaeodactylibacter sp. TaxID=1940289 RepID=UPI0032EF660D